MKFIFPDNADDDCLSCKATAEKQYEDGSIISYTPDEDGSSEGKPESGIYQTIDHPNGIYCGCIR